jgi:NADH dehydrogenase
LTARGLVKSGRAAPLNSPPPILYASLTVAGEPRQSAESPRKTLQKTTMFRQFDVNRLVTVFGGSGFVGRHLVRALCKRGYRIRVAVRRPDLAGFLQPLGRVGQIHAVQANLRHAGSVEAALRDADAAINLVGIMYETGKQRFSAVQGEGAGTVARAAAALDIPLVHMSALGANAESGAAYARAKAEGERLVLEAKPDAVIFRPSIVFGPDDSFFNRFAGMARLSPVLPLIGGGETRFQPVFVGDVATAMADAVDGKATGGTTYELGGPEVRSFKELMQEMLTLIGRKRLLLPIPFPVAKGMAVFTGILPNAPLTSDQVELLKSDTVVSEAAAAEGRTFAHFGIRPQLMEAILPSYLWRFRRAGQYSRGAVL